MDAGNVPYPVRAAESLVGISPWAKRIRSEIDRVAEDVLLRRQLDLLQGGGITELVECGAAEVADESECTAQLAAGLADHALKFFTFLFVERLSGRQLPGQLAFTVGSARTGPRQLSEPAIAFLVP